MWQRMNRGGQVGVAGGGLTNAPWAASAEAARVGRAGELDTAALITPHVSAGGPFVLHDLRIPGSDANIDHVVVAGQRVLLIDSKRWRPGFYWTVAGRSFCGWRPRPFADKATMKTAATRVRNHLEARGLPARVAAPIVVIWPSSARRKLRVWALRIPGARSYTAAQFRRRVGRLIGDAAADQAVVSALTGLVNDKPRQARQPRRRRPTRPGRAGQIEERFR